MNSEQVTRRQARIIQSRVEPFRMYLHELHERMANRGFGPGDPFLKMVKAAQQSVGEMYVYLEIQRREGPTALPENKTTPWLEQKSARKRHDRR